MGTNSHHTLSLRIIIDGSFTFSEAIKVSFNLNKVLSRFELCFIDVFLHLLLQDSFTPDNYLNPQVYMYIF